MQHQLYDIFCNPLPVKKIINMADNKKIKALKNSRKKENKMYNAPCSFQNRSNKKDDEMVSRYPNVIPIYAYIN